MNLIIKIAIKDFLKYNKSNEKEKYVLHKFIFITFKIWQGSTFLKYHFYWFYVSLPIKNKTRGDTTFPRILVWVSIVRLAQEPGAKKFYIIYNLVYISPLKNYYFCMRDQTQNNRGHIGVKWISKIITKCNRLDFLKSSRKICFK